MIFFFDKALIKRAISLIDNSNFFDFQNVSPFPRHEKIFMVYTVLLHNPDVIFDWGTHLGVSARIFHEIKQFTSLKYDVHTTDVRSKYGHPERPISDLGKYIEEAKEAKEVTQHFGDGVTVSLKLLKKSNKYKKPLFFVDGDHAEKTVFRELSSIFKNVEDPVALVHDTWSNSGGNIGPWLACKKLATDNQLFIFFK